MDKSVRESGEAVTAQPHAEVESADGEMLAGQALAAKTEAAKTVAAKRGAQLGPVLVAVNFSDDSEEALLWACDYARSMNAPIEVLHVIHDPADAPGQYKSSSGDPLEPMADVAERKFADFLSHFRAAHPRLEGIEDVKTICTTGVPASTILDVARKHGARLLVLGSQGRNGFSEFFLGSTSHKVARHAPMPVTIVRANARENASAA